MNFSIPTIKTNSFKKFFLIFLVAFFTTSSFFIGRFIFKNLKKATSVNPVLISELTPRIDTTSVKKATQILEQKTSPITVSKPKLSPLPSPSPQKETLPPGNKEQKPFEVQILNGTPKENIAQEIAPKIENLGYTVKNISPADRKDYSSTIIRLKSDAEVNYEEIKQALYPTFANFVKEKLTDQSTVDIVIILGQ